jgi:WD40 repeat protein
MQLATCGDDGKVVISHANGEQEFELSRHGAKVMALVFCGNDQLAAAGSDNLIHVWDLTTRTKSAELAGHTGTIAVLAYHHGLLISTGFDTTIRTWRLLPTAASGELDAPQRAGARRPETMAR